MLPIYLVLLFELETGPNQEVEKLLFPYNREFSTVEQCDQWMIQNIAKARYSLLKAYPEGTIALRGATCDNVFEILDAMGYNVHIT
jgi:hypothetical protein